MLHANDALSDADKRALMNIFSEVGGAVSDDSSRYSSRWGHTPPRDQPGGGTEYRGSGDNGGSPFGGGGRSYADAADPAVRGFRDFIVRGIPPADQYRDMEVSGPAAAFVPQAFYPLLTEARRSWGGVIEAVNVRETTDGAPMKFAFSNDTGNLAHVVGETGPVNETDPSLTSLLLSTDQLVTDIIKISIAELQDSAFDLDKFVRDQFGKRYFRGLTSIITAGSASGNIASLVSGAYPAVTSLYSNGIAWDDLTAMFGALDPSYIENASFMMKSTTRAYMLGVKDGFGRPLYVPAPTVAAFDRLLGLPVVLNQYMDPIQASTTSPAFGNIPLLLGDFKQGYTLRNVKPGLAIARLNERFMDTLEVGFLGYFRSGGVMTDAGTHPIVALVQNTTGSFPSSD